MASNPSLYPPLPQAPYCTHLLLTSSPPPLSCCTRLQVHLQQVYYTTLHLLTLYQRSTHCTILHLFTHQQVHGTLCAICSRIMRLRNLRKVAFIATLTAHPLHCELYCRLPPSPTCHQAALCLIHISRKQKTHIEKYTKKYTKTQQTDIEEHNPIVNQLTLLLLVKQVPIEFCLQYLVFQSTIIITS